MKSIKKEISEILINQLIDHPEFNKEKFLKTNPQLKEVVEKALKEREDRKKLKRSNRVENFNNGSGGGQLSHDKHEGLNLKNKSLIRLAD